MTSAHTKLHEFWDHFGILWSSPKRGLPVLQYSIQWYNSKYPKKLAENVHWKSLILWNHLQVECFQQSPQVGCEDSPGKPGRLWTHQVSRLEPTTALGSLPTSASNKTIRGRKHRNLQLTKIYSYNKKNIRFFNIPFYRIIQDNRDSILEILLRFSSPSAAPAEQTSSNQDPADHWWSDNMLRQYFQNCL